MAAEGLIVSGWTKDKDHSQSEQNETNKLRMKRETRVTQTTPELNRAFVNIDNRSYMLAIEGAGQRPGLEAIDDLQITNMFGVKHVLQNHPLYDKIAQVHL